MSSISSAQSFLNINTISQGTDQKVEAFRIVKIQGVGQTPEYAIRKNGFFRQLALQIKHAFSSSQKTLHRHKLQTLIASDVEKLNNASFSAFINPETHAYTELFLAAQRYNRAVQLHGDPLLKQEVPIFEKLALNTLIAPLACPQLAPIKMGAVVTEALKGIPNSQQPHIQMKGCFKKHKVFHYNHADTKINHALEALRIFICTQIERLISLIGRICEAVARLFKHKLTLFKNDHYYRNDEDKSGKIYANDAPLSTSDKPTSYWIGHATCLINVALDTENGQKIRLNIITDPIEGDLNKVFYPRMTKAARAIDDCPVPHVFMLSHGHLDHCHPETIKKLRKHQPIMLVPEGDEKKLKDLGFKNVYAHNWWQTTTIPVWQNGQEAELMITAVPAHHWAGGHRTATVGYVIRQDEGDIYFAGDTARLSEEHIASLREHFFDIRTIFQPGGPDEIRKDMESTHQSSADALWMHFNLMIRKLYDNGGYSAKSKADFLKEAKKLRTVYMHTKTYKLGNLHFDDTDESVRRVEESLNQGTYPAGTRSYEKRVVEELLAIGKKLSFQDADKLEAHDILALLKASVVIPKIGSRTQLA